MSSQFENWSWGCTLNMASTDIPGATSLQIQAGTYAGFSLKSDAGYLNNYAGLSFEVSGTSPDVTISFSSTANSDQSQSFALSELSSAINPNNLWAP
jgi:hypothetical protein